MNDYVTKPVNRKELIRAISKQLLPESSFEPAEQNTRAPRESKPMLFNQEAFLDLTMGDHELAKEIAQRVIPEMQSLATEITGLLQTEDYAALRTTLHTAKGYALNTASQKLAETIRSMEQFSAKQEKALIEMLMPELSKDLDQTVAAIQKFLQES